MLKNSILSSLSGQEEKLYSDSVFSTWLYTGNGATQTINNGIDLAGKGGMVWTKGRSGASRNHWLNDSVRGVANGLNTNTTNAQSARNVTSFNSNGYTTNPDFEYNANGETFVSWTFRNADKFYGHQVVTKSAGSNATVNFANLGTLGMVRVKRTDASGSWYIWHRSLSAGQLLVGETTAAAATLGHVTVSGTTVTLVNSVIADGTYLVEAFAHDAGADGIIQCGSFTTDGSGNATVNLGWEPQYVFYKSTTAVQNWFIQDNMRGLPNPSSDSPILFSNLSNAESTDTKLHPTATGFVSANAALSGNQTYIYLAIRRPNKPPTTGAQVYNAIARTGTGAAATVTGVGFAPDLYLVENRTGVGGGNLLFDRLRGANNLLRAYDTGQEVANSGTCTSINQDGVSLGTDATYGHCNYAASTYINHFFRRAPGFMDVVCDTGTGAAHAITHNLTKAPELSIRKSRSAATQWEVWHSAMAATEKLVLNSTAAKATDATAWNSTVPTASQFTVGTGANVNANAATFVTYLFATLAGISKVGSYTGNGSTQTIDCGFSTGARFIMCKRTDSTGDWYIWDSVRGIVSANDPHLSLNTAAAEVTTDDSVDPNSVGFDVLQNTATNINVNLASYIFLAIA